MPSKNRGSTLSTLVAGLLTAYVAASAYMAYSLTRVKRVPVRLTPKQAGLSYENVAFSSRADPIRLKGWYIPHDNPTGWIILVHGEQGNRADSPVNAMGLIRDLHQAGFGLLMFDLRSHGESEGEGTSLGYFERRDLEGAIDFLLSRDVPKDRIGLLGFGLGASLAIMVAREESGLAGVVADSAFARLSDLVRRGRTPSRGYPTFFMPGLFVLSRLLYGSDIGKVKPVEAVKEISFPVFFVHGMEDTVIPFSHSRQLWQASPNPDSQLWLIPGVGHLRAYTTFPQQYVNRIATYFRQAVGAVRQSAVQGVGKAAKVQQDLTQRQASPELSPLPKRPA